MVLNGMIISQFDKEVVYNAKNHAKIWQKVECKWKGDRWSVEATMEMSMQRMADLERRVLALEERTRRSLWTQEAALASKEEELLGRYGEYVDKTLTAKILGVTRATVYAMLADGRIEGACSGRRVSVRSIAHYMAAPKSRGRRGLQPLPNGMAM